MTGEGSGVRVTMVKKRLKNGEPCKKCMQAEELLQRRGLWDSIDEVVWANEDDASSPGVILAQKYQVDVAPFFLVEEGGDTRVFSSVVQVAKEVLSKKSQSDTPVLSTNEPRVTESDVVTALQSLKERTPQEIVKNALSKLGDRCAIAFSGAEDVALIDMAVKSGLPFSVFCLDTGRLHPETYRFIDTVRQFYGIEIQIVTPNFVSVDALVRRKGLFSFYEDSHTECCGVRKLEPLRRVLRNFDGWITGQRRDQSPTRSDVPEISWDTSHNPKGLMKFNPLAATSQDEVWEYIRENDVPYNELHDRGFASIGCEPCTRASRPGEHERAGRWWWEAETKRECGLHLK